MEARLSRAYVVELIGTFALVLFAAGLVCVNQVTTPAGQTAGTAGLTLHQPGLFGLALGQGLILAVMLAVTVPYSGGYLNPAVTLMLWVYGRIGTVRASWLIGAQLIGGVLAAAVLHFTFTPDIVRAAQYGAPHLNPLAYPALSQAGVTAGVGVELVLTFFLVFAIFGLAREPLDAPRAGWAAGAVLAASVLFAFPLTGAALNPARWFGPVLLETISGDRGRSPWADTLVYLAGPIIGALLAGFVCFKLFPAVEAGAAKGRR